MNKLRLIKIYELKGKIHPIESFMIGVLDGIEEYQSHSEIIFYRKNGFNYLVHILSTNDIRTTNIASYTSKDGEFSNMIGPIKEMIGDTMVLKAENTLSKKIVYTKIIIE